LNQSREQLLPILSRLAHDDQLRRDLSRNARIGYEAFYTRENYLTRYLALVERIASAKRQRVEI